LADNTFGAVVNTPALIVNEISLLNLAPVVPAFGVGTMQKFLVKVP